MRASERFDKWINLHSVVQRMDELETDDGLFGASTAGEDSLIGQIEQLVRGGDTPRRVRRASEAAERSRARDDAPRDDGAGGGAGADGPPDADRSSGFVRPPQQPRGPSGGVPPTA